MIRWCLHATPCGVLRLGAFGGRLCLCDWADVPARDFVVRRLERGLHVRFAEWPNERLRPGTGLPGIPAEPESNFPDNPDDADRCVLDRAVRQLDEYFAAQRRVFDVPLLTVGTPFQRAVWELLTEIYPPGENPLLRVAGGPAGTSASRAGRRCGQPRQCPFDLHSLPPRRRQRRLAHGLRRRPCGQTAAARTGAGDASPLTELPRPRHPRHFTPSTTLSRGPCGRSGRSSRYSARRCRPSEQSTRSD